MKTGEKYGMLTLLEKVPRPEGQKRKGTYWKCSCDCGQTCVKHYNDIWSGNTKSCGCLKKRKPIYDKCKIEISNNAGIYGFQNIYNGRWYIGKTKNLYHRYLSHKSEWTRNNNKQFYQAIKKYGWESFNYYILKEYLEPPTAQQLSEEEEYYIRKYNAYHKGYNASEKSSGGFYSQGHKNKCTQILHNLNEQQKNENHPRTDFTKEEILQIFDYAMQGAPVKWVYERYKDHKITYESFKNIYSGKHFKDYLPKNWEKRPQVSTNATLWGSWVQDIKTRFLKGETIEEVDRIYAGRVNRRQLNEIKNEKSYKHIHPCID